MNQRTDQKTGPNTTQQPDILDRILADEEALLPTSGFAASVMDVIEEQAAAPAPIPFPWKLAVPGMGALVAVLVMITRLAASAIQSVSESSGGYFLSTSKFDFTLSPILRTQVVPAVLALAAALVCMWLCRRLAGSVR
jgi:hypothetical protein